MKPFSYALNLFILMVAWHTSPCLAKPSSPELTIEQKLRDDLPMALRFRDESGRDLSLADVATNRPLLIAPVYYACPNLCQMTLDNLVASLDGINLDAGQAFDVAVISINPKDTPQDAQRRKTSIMAKYKRHPAQGWHFLTGSDETIKQLMASIGFQYRYDEAQKQYNHPSAVVIATPAGQISRYIYGLEFPKRDLRLALVEAADGRIGNPIDRFLLYCFHYDPSQGRYGWQIMNVMRIGALTTILAMIFGLVSLYRREPAWQDSLVKRGKS